jgi:Pyridoxamine 5'-phosphate oxidase
MVTWAHFQTLAPSIAGEGRRLLRREGIDQGLLATVRGADLPRIHPVYVAIVDGRLYTFLTRSAKRGDLAHDGRFALHAHQDPTAPSEFSIRGRASRVEDAGERARVSAGWAFEADDSYALFELSIEGAVLGSRTSPDEWPPRYTSWAAGRADGLIAGR